MENKKHKCKYCGNETKNTDTCNYCKEKKTILSGWHWEYNPKETIKIK